MSIYSAVFGEGQLPDSQTTLVTFSDAAVGVQMQMHNSSASACTIKLYITPGSSSRQVAEFSLASGESAVWDFRAIEAGDGIEGYASVAASFFIQVGHQ